MRMKQTTFLILALIVVAVLSAFHTGIFYWQSIEPSAKVTGVSNYFFSLLLVFWIIADRKKYPQISCPYEFGNLIFMISIFYLPYYLWRTRRLHGLLMLAGFLGLFWMGFAVQYAIYFYRSH
jgi:hypothetical protein